jgi:hypothetical protein
MNMNILLTEHLLSSCFCACFSQDCLNEKEYEEVLGVTKEKYFSMSPAERTALKEKLGLM